MKIMTEAGGTYEGVGVLDGDVIWDALEGVRFLVPIKDNELLLDGIQVHVDDQDYFSNFNQEKFIKEAKEILKEEDLLHTLDGEEIYIERSFEELDSSRQPVELKLERPEDILRNIHTF